MLIWIMIVEDRHADTDVIPFASEQAAVDAARSLAGHDGAAGDELTAGMREDGWVLCCPVSDEGDSIRVVRRVMAAGS